jgi:hypothetical protein
LRNRCTLPAQSDRRGNTHGYCKENIMIRGIAFILLASSAFALHAQPMPNGGPGGPGAHGPPPHAMLIDELAASPDLSIAQQQEIRKILSERRDAHDLLAIKQRNEHERIDETANEKLRKLLGDDGYRHFAQAQLAHGPHHPAPPQPGAAPSTGDARPSPKGD